MQYIDVLHLRGYTTNMDKRQRHYEIYASWLERLGLAVVASMVLQMILSGALLNDPIVKTGLLIALALYLLAFVLIKLS
ncbi:MAG: hypothetical protein AAB930_03665 [Patescibacteria group bacterium]